MYSVSNADIHLATVYAQTKKATRPAIRCLTVLRLRKLLGSSDAVVQQGGKVWLNPELCWVDAWAFEDRIACY